MGILRCEYVIPKADYAYKSRGKSQMHIHEAITVLAVTLYFSREVEKVTQHLMP